jgi:hypothetical protein
MFARFAEKKNISFVMTILVKRDYSIPATNREEGAAQPLELSRMANASIFSNNKVPDTAFPFP